MFRQLVSRLRSLWHWRRKESELDEEIAFHLSEEAEERAADGMRLDEARLAATRDFGSAVRVREATRDAWGWAGPERLMQDTRNAVRMVRRNPGFSAVAVLTLALGIGATTAILNLVEALVLRPLPMVAADRLVVLFATTPKRGISRDTTSFLDFTAWKDESRAFTAAAAYGMGPRNITGDGAPEPVVALSASHELLTVLGVAPAVGRIFDKQEQQGNQAVALISHGLWTRRYSNDPRILGRPILLNEVSHVVIGVLPPAFQFPPFRNTDVLVPIVERTCRSCGYIRAVARLRPGVSVATAQEELDAIAARRAKMFPDSNEGRGVNVVPLQEVVVGDVRTPLLVLLGAGVFVLLIGCGNVGNLVLARGIARRRELAVRSALGAGTGRIVRQLVTESLTLALVAAAIGAVFAHAGSDLLLSSLSQRIPLPPVTFNWYMLAFALLIAIVSGVLSGLPPALMVWKADLNDSLKQDGRGQSGGAKQLRLRNLLVVSQTALTVMLLVGAGLLVKSFILLQRVELNLNPRHVLTADLLLSATYVDPERRAIYVQALLDSVQSLPGVQRVAVQTESPADGGGSRETFTIDGLPDPGPQNGHPVSFNRVGGDFFRALDIAIVRGHDFHPQVAANAAPVAIVNETMARRFWPNGEALGKRMRFYYDTDPQRWLTIIGVVRDARYRYEEPTPQVFVPYRQGFYRPLRYPQQPFVSLVVRTAGDPAAFAAAVRASIWAVDKNQPILTLQSMETILWESVSEERVFTLLLGVYAAIALAIATAGIYALSAYAVVRRTHEIGIRLAVGATSRQILALVLRSGMTHVLTGVAIGIVGSLTLTRVVSRFLHGITATDAPTFLAVLLLFAAVAFIATYIPARRAAKTDPTIAFRCD